MRHVLQTVTSLLAPPTSPRGLDRSWDEVEGEIGLALPDDYKSFIDLYGSGQVASAEGWAVIWNFRDYSMFGRSLSEGLRGPESVTEFYRRKINTTDYPCPFPIYPEPEGLLPFASVVDVQNLNWLTSGPPNQWDVVYFHFDGLEFTRLEGDSFSGCLLKMLRREYSGLEQPSSLRGPFEFVALPE
jgi:hypothetical protein